MEVTDAAVVAQVLTGDKDAFRVLVERHSRSIYRLVYRMTGNPHDAEELVQDTFLRAYKALERFELRSNFATWLHRIAVNRTLDFLSSRKMKGALQVSEEPEFEEQQTVQLRTSAPGPERLLLSAELQSKISQAMALLTPVERVAFTMRHMEGRSMQEICQALNIRTNAAKNSVFRAVHKLRQRLEPMMSSAK